MDLRLRLYLNIKYISLLEQFVGLNVSKLLKRKLKRRESLQMVHLSEEYGFQYAFLQIIEDSKVLFK